MSFTLDGLKEQRNDIYEDITHIVVTNAESTELCRQGKETFEIQGDADANPKVFKVVVSGASVGLGNTVAGYKLVKDSVVLFETSLSSQNTCVT